MTARRAAFALLAISVAAAPAAVAQAVPAVLPCIPYPACIEPPPPPAKPLTCLQQNSGISGEEPQYGQSMQSCCSANPGNCGTSNPDFTVSPNTKLCDSACAPPSMGNVVGGAIVPDSGWAKGANIEVYIDPALSTYTFSRAGRRR